MRKLVITTTSLLFFLTLIISPTFAQDNHTAREEKEGKAIWQNLQSKQITCDKLSDEEFGALGEYFMEQMVGDSHEAMNTMMERMMGKEGEEQMHVVMGKRLSGCRPDAQFPQAGVGFMPMMWMMGSAGSPQVGGGGNPMMGTGFGNMMGGWGGFGVFGWFTMVLFWTLIILGVIALIRYLARTAQDKGEKTPSDILKERYARGEIDKKEFEEMKKDLR